MSQAPTDPPAPRRAPRWMRIALFGSLAVNLLIVGIVAGVVLRGPADRDADRRPMLRDLGLGPFIEALPVRDRVALGRDAAREARQFRSNRETVRLQFEEFLALVRAEPFDPEAAKSVIGAQQAKLMELRGIGRDLLIARLAEMEADDRRDYADRLDGLLRRPPAKRRD